MPFLSFETAGVKCVNRVSRVVKMAEASKSSHATPWALVCIRLSEMTDGDGKLPNGLRLHPILPELLSKLNDDIKDV